MNTPKKCLVIDDEPLAIEIIKGYIDRIPQLEFVQDCTDAMEAFKYLSDHDIDLLFLDIEMPEISGIDFIKNIPSCPPVILTTAYREYAIESYELAVVDYLLKPISFNRFFKAITKFLDLNSVKAGVSSEPKSVNQEKSYMYVYADRKNVKVDLDEILYIESIKDYIRIHMTHQNIIAKDTITRYEHILPHAFLRIHRSYIVNTSKITAFTQQDIEIGPKQLPIGVSYKRQVIDRLKS